MDNLVIDNLTDNPLEAKINLMIQNKGIYLRAFVRDETVFLSGEVQELQIKKEITRLVEQFPGIRFITNHIRVRLPDASPTIEHF